MDDVLGELLSGQGALHPRLVECAESRAEEDPGKLEAEVARPGVCQLG